MATHRKKVVEVEARKYLGPASLTVIHDLKGEQRAKKGDWLVGNEKGKIEVVTDTEFQQMYEPIGDESTVTRVHSLGTNHPTELPVGEAPLHETTIPGETLDSDGTLGDHEVPVAETADGAPDGNLDDPKAVGETAKVEDVDGNTHELVNKDGQLDTTTHQQ
jgi:hypothetical protein